MRQREELSITIAPASAKAGAQWPEAEPPAEKRATSNPSIDSSLRPRTTSPPSSSRPTERSEANGTISRAGNRRSRSRRSISVPTCPVAPTIATRYPSLLIGSGYRGPTSAGHATGHSAHRRRRVGRDRPGEDGGEGTAAAEPAVLALVAVWLDPPQPASRPTPTRLKAVNALPPRTEAMP